MSKKNCGGHVESVALAVVVWQLLGWQRKRDTSVASFWSAVFNRSVSIDRGETFSVFFQFNFLSAEGTLLGIIENAFRTHLLLDESEERSIAQDLLLARVCCWLRQEKNFKVVLMGATIHIHFLHKIVPKNFVSHK